MKKSDKAYARAEMFQEAADHLDLEVTNDPDERAEIPYVQKVIRGYADRWFKKYKTLRDSGN